jgi:hypothetical protein
MRSPFFAAALAAPAFALAAGMSPDPTGLWWVPQESGWGLSLTQQQDTVVAVVFVYDDAQRPVWYVASATDSGTHLDPTGEEVFAGTLYRTSGPWFGGGFDPHSVTAAAVGTLQLASVPASPGKNISLVYSVNGVSVTKTVQPQTWGSNAAALRGSYGGALTFPATPESGCNLIADLFRTPTSFSFDDAFAPGEVAIVWGTGIDTYCAAHGAYLQRGLLGRIEGYLSCQPLGFPLSTDMTITIADLAATANGFNATATIRRGNCTYAGRIGGVRQVQ